MKEIARQVLLYIVAVKKKGKNISSVKLEDSVPWTDGRITW